jgi:hypothetical protein
MTIRLSCSFGSGVRWLRFIRRMLGVTFVMALLLFPHSAPASTIPCLGDCAGDERVTVDDLIKGVNIAPGASEVGTCPAFDLAGDGSVTVDELVKAVNKALSGCFETVAVPELPAGGIGGGILNGNPGTLTLTNSTLIGNAAGDDGGIVNTAWGGEIGPPVVPCGSAIVTNTTLSGNSADTGGGGAGNGGGDSICALR